MLDNFRVKYAVDSLSSSTLYLPRSLIQSLIVSRTSLGFCGDKHSSYDTSPNKDHPKIIIKIGRNGSI